MQTRLAASCCACAALWLQPAIAQQQYTPVNPADPHIETPLPRHQSALDGYRPFRGEKIRPWRDVNDEVARTGGHAGIFGGNAHAGHGAHQAPVSTPPGAPK